MDPEVIVDPPAALAGRFVRRFEAAARQAIGAHGRFVCVVPGGSAARVLLPALVGVDVEWPRVDVFWGDERAVPSGDPRANYDLARRLWLDHVPLDPTRVHRIHGEETDLHGAAAAYARELACALEGRPLDLVLLGMGPEGHVCSLFPDHRALDESAHTVVAIDDSPKPPSRRITLTLVALAGAALVCVAAFGAEKAAAAQEALESPPSRLPAALAARAARRSLFLLDPRAASRLAPR